ncbi:hypothetical protein [Neobacillus cucumis]|uniref:Group-specific protein n=1 Tax=Neobacillus cucumis TaxID=1740721 RepID=A0A2N5HDF3_9BACI|nr:hypothetical protein [Neobacillus cucumis]PLS03534.1 hypothetical protein CVD27_14200 [Neobacillus cucumis]
MFDPTAFDNMKVVIEGAFYDLDLKGDIVITDRNDLFNMAKMSRSFDISFRLPYDTVIAKVEISSKMINLAAELLPAIKNERQAGVFVRLEFILKQEKELNYQEVKHILLDIWGEDRDISLSSHYNPLESDKNLSTLLTIDFGRLITEDQMDDLVEMTNFIITTLERLC